MPDNFPLAAQTTCVCVAIGTEAGPNQYITGPEACGGITGVASLCTMRLCSFLSGTLATRCCGDEDGGYYLDELASASFSDPFTFYV